MAFISPDSVADGQTTKTSWGNIVKNDLDDLNTRVLALDVDSTDHENRISAIEASTGQNYTQSAEVNTRAYYSANSAYNSSSFGDISFSMLRSGGVNHNINGTIEIINIYGETLYEPRSSKYGDSIRVWSGTSWGYIPGTFAWPWGLLGSTTQGYARHAIWINIIGAEVVDDATGTDYVALYGHARLKHTNVTAAIAPSFTAPGLYTMNTSVTRTTGVGFSEQRYYDNATRGGIMFKIPFAGTWQDLATLSMGGYNNYTNQKIQGYVTGDPDASAPVTVNLRGVNLGNGWDSMYVNYWADFYGGSAATI